MTDQKSPVQMATDDMMQLGIEAYLRIKNKFDNPPSWTVVEAIYKAMHPIPAQTAEPSKGDDADPAEAAYWLFDAKRKGYPPHLHVGERTAFKDVYRSALRPQPVTDAEEAFEEALKYAYDTSAADFHNLSKDAVRSICLGFKHGLETHIHALSRQPAAVDAWQPIETAPRDGTEILVACTYPDGRISVVANARWIESNHPPYNEFWHDIENAMGQDDVSLWMPLNQSAGIKK